MGKKENTKVPVNKVFQMVVKEVHEQTYEVVAPSKEEALQAYKDGDASALEGTLEYSRTMDDHLDVSDVHQVSPHGTFCANCGFDVRVDADHLCTECGSTAAGVALDNLVDGLKYIMDDISEVPEEIKDVLDVGGHDIGIIPAPKAETLLRILEEHLQLVYRTLRDIKNNEFTMED